MNNNSEIGSTELTNEQLDAVSGGFLVEIIQKAADDIDKILYPTEPYYPPFSLGIDKSEEGGN